MSALLPRPGSGERPRRGRVVVVGSVNEDTLVTVDRLPGPGETVIGHHVSLLPGGKGANQAVAAARAGGDVFFVGAVGDDAAGGRSAAHLTDAGVDLSGLMRWSDTPTGIAMVVVSASGENQIVVVAGANATLDGPHVTAALDRLLLTPSDVCLVGFEVGDAAVSAAARSAREAGCALLLNPAPARALPAEAVKAGPVLLPNASEAELLTGEADEYAAARALADLTGSAVVITLGARGALVRRDGAAELVPSPAVDVVDTTGAGDTLAGVLATALADGVDLTLAVRRAAVAAALSVTATGARDGMPTKDLIDQACAP